MLGTLPTQAAGQGTLSHSQQGKEHSLGSWVDIDIDIDIDNLFPKNQYSACYVKVAKLFIL